MNEIINGIEIYSISNVALEIYRNNAKKGADADRVIIERKLTALIINSRSMATILNNKHIYKFGGFVMTVNEKTKKIEVIHWYNDDHSAKPIDKKSAMRLKDTFKLLGLSGTGNSYAEKKVV